MHHLGIGNVLQCAPLLQDTIEQGIHILNLGTGIQDVLYALQPATLNPFLLGVRQRRGDSGFAQRKGKGAPQMQVQFPATGKAG